MKQFEEIEHNLKSKLKESRYTHTMGVAYTAAAMAMKYGISVERAYLTGLLHDCAKNIPEEEMFMLCQQHKISLSEAEQQNPQLIHAKLGAWIAKEEYRIEDEEILNAIRLHTTGAPNMTVLEQIIYIADYIEPNRKPLPHMDKIRQLAFTDLNQTMEVITTDILKYLESIGSPIDSMTMQTNQYYIQYNREKRN